MSNIVYIDSYEKVKELYVEACNSFEELYYSYVDIFLKYNIQMTIKPYCYYKGKFISKMKKRGCYTIYRICLFPKNLTYTQAKKAHLYKEFFSKKILQYKFTKNGYKVKFFSKKDVFLERFLIQILSKSKKLQLASTEPNKALKENLFDIINSIILIYRYRTAAKSTYYDFDLEWILLLIIIIVIWIRVEMHLRLLYS